MKLYTIKFANGLYLSRLARKLPEDYLGDTLTSDINEAYIYHDPECQMFNLEEDKVFFTNYYKATMEKGGGSYKLIEVKIVEVEDDTINEHN